jgi:translation initiation factor IF-3
VEDLSISLDHKKARINRQIRAREVRLIGVDGQQVGVVSILEALKMAEEAELDLVEIAPTVVPPVCRIMDYGKYLFEQNKRHKHKTSRVQVKEIKMRPVTEIGDYNVKVRKARGFLEENHKVKFSVRFRGREMDFQSLGMEILQRAANDLKEYGVVEQQPKVEGRQMIMLMSPGKGGASAHAHHNK